METQKNNPLHNITLEQILNYLVANHGWEYLASQVNVNCFKKDPSIKSSLTFLRRNQWARTRIEDIYVYLIKKDAKRN